MNNIQSTSQPQGLMCYNCRKMGHITKYSLEASQKPQHNKRKPNWKPAPSNKRAGFGNMGMYNEKEQGN